MSKLTGNPNAYSLPLYSTESTITSPLGVIAYSEDGSKWRYVLAGAVDLVPDNLIQSPAVIADHQNMAVVADVAVGATTMTVTLGATAVTENQYAGGYVVINAGAGIGQRFGIKSHAAALAGASLVLNLDEQVRTALLLASSKASLSNPYSKVIQNPTTATAAPIGVCTYAIPANTYGWIMVNGYCSVLADATVVAVGNGLKASTTTAGCVTAVDAAGYQIGVAAQATISAEARLARIMLG